MAFYDGWFSKKEKKIDEAIKSFENKGDSSPEKVRTMMAQKGEGVEDIYNVQGFGNVGIQSFNSFYDRHINKNYENEIEKIYGYRQMAEQTEIGDVVEDATNESTMENDAGKTFQLDIIDPELAKNDNIVRNINNEFNDLFYEKIHIEDHIWDFFRTFFIDGRLYFEKLIDTRRPKKGIIGIKKLPSETMDYLYSPVTNKIKFFFQYLSSRPVRPKTIEEAVERKDLVVFNPEQISFLNYGIFGKSKHTIFGYLEKVKIPYNTLKLLETSVVIYRIVRAPERLVFRIDTGNMPRDKALKYVEKIKQKMTKKQTYDPASGKLSHSPEIMSLLENYYMPQSAEGRGSQIDTVGGDAKGFTELDDLYYFARKMYRALKYPMSRVTAGEENRSADIMFGGSNTAEITRDEVKWSRFLERQQNKFCKEFTKLFLLHLEFKGIKDQYGLNDKKIRLKMNPPSNYKEQMEQNFMESRFSNYTMMADRNEFSKYWLMKKYLKYSDEEIKANADGKEKDKKLGFKEEESF
jgi:hypothetical protein